MGKSLFFWQGFGDKGSTSGVEFLPGRAEYRAPAAYAIQADKSRHKVMHSENGSRQIEIRFSADGLDLRGIYHVPGKPSPPFVVGSHGLFSDGDVPPSR